MVVTQQAAVHPIVMQQTTMSQQQAYPDQAYPGQQPYSGQQPYPGQQPVMMAQGGEAPPGYDEAGLPPKQ